jgi:hypothetical protein
MKYALIHGARICQFVADAEACFPVAPELQWVEVADTATEADRYQDGQVVTYVAPPSPPAKISYGTMRIRMTEVEREAVLVACRSNWQIDDFVRLAQAEGEINLASDVTATAKAAVVAAGLLTPERADAVFAPLG